MLLSSLIPRSPIRRLAQRFRALASGRAARLLADDLVDPQRPYERAPHPFDLAHGVDTSGLLYMDQLVTGHPHDRFSEGYYATAPSLFRGALSLWARTLNGYSVDDYAFIDLGCGKGRVLMMASEYPFRSITGVELNPALVESARTNLRQWMRSPRACQDVSAMPGDVLEAPLPESPIVLFLFNAFERELVRTLLDRLQDRASRRRVPIDLIYVHPEHDDLVSAAPRVETILNEQILFSAEDAAADAFQVNFDQCCIYRIRGRQR